MMMLGVLIKKYRLVMEIDLRTLAAEIGIGTTTLMRIEHGRSPNAAALLKILNWLLAEKEGAAG